MLCSIWYHFYNFQNVKNTHGGVLLLNSNTPPSFFFAFFKLYKWYQIAQRITHFLFIAAFYELEELVLNADSIDDIDLVDGLVCGAIKNLKANRLKPDPMLYLTLSNLAKINYNIFTSKRVVEVSELFF